MSVSLTPISDRVVTVRGWYSTSLELEVTRTRGIRTPETFVLSSFRVDTGPGPGPDAQCVIANYLSRSVTVGPGGWGHGSSSKTSERGGGGRTVWVWTEGIRWVWWRDTKVRVGETSDPVRPASDR